MTDIISVEKDESDSKPVPTIWRSTICEIVDAFVDGDYELTRGVSNVAFIDSSDVKAIETNINDYGVSLCSMPEETWETSVCQWMGDYWEVLIDLFSHEEGLSDLAMSIRVKETGQDYTFQMRSVHVP